MTQLYVAGAEHLAQGIVKGWWSWDFKAQPLNGLVSFFYVKAWRDALAAGLDSSGFERLMLDSGAYSAWSSGKSIDIVALCEESKRSEWGETVGLDVIGDSRGSVANLDRMRALGSPAYPVFHIGDPWSDLEHYCAHWPKVGLSCRFGEPLKDSMRFLDQSFARAWPHAFHSFGWVQHDVLARFPFESADSATWIIAAKNRSVLHWKRGRISRSSFFGLTEEYKKKIAMLNIAAMIEMQTDLAARWKRDLAQLKR